MTVAGFFSFLEAEGLKKSKKEEFRGTNQLCTATQGVKRVRLGFKGQIWDTHWPG